jgi:predicted DNA-binding protein YlxM (UPF0122 family)
MVKLMNDKFEKWSFHNHYPDYAISDFGRVFSYKTNSMLTLIKNENGYLRVNIIDVNNFSRLEFVHKLVLETFVGPRPPKHICRHYPDQNPANNFLTNLSWSTPQQNNYDRIENDTYNCATLTIDQVLIIKEKIKQGVSLTNLSEEFNISLQVLSNIKNNNIWKNIGEDITEYHFKLKRKKLTTNDAVIIKLILNSKLYSQYKIADMFNVDQSAISNINRGVSFIDVPLINLSLKEALIKYKNNENLLNY